MSESVLIFAVMFVIQIAASVFFKNAHRKVLPFTFLAAVVGALIAGFGLPVRELIEGWFGYLEPVMYAAVGTVACAALYYGGTFDFILEKIQSISSGIVRAYLLLLLAALPAMISGSATVALLTSGVIIGTSLKNGGVDKKKAAVFVAFGAVIGAILPPFSLVGMVLMRNFAGASLPLAVFGVPMLLVFGAVSSSWIGKPSAANEENKPAKKAACLISLLVGLLLYAAYDFGKSFLPFLGLPLIALIILVLAIAFPAGKRAGFKEICDFFAKIAPILATVIVAGSFQEILALCGIKGNFNTAMYFWNNTVITIAGFAVVILLGIFAGGAPSLSMAIICTYFGYSSYSVLIGYAAAVLLGALLSRNNGLLKQAETIIGVEEGGSAARDTKAAWLPLALMLLMMICYMIARTELSALRL